MPIEGLPAPLAMSFAHLNRLGGDVSMLLGYVNIPGVVRSLKESDSEPLQTEAKITHQFYMSLSAFAGLHRVVNEFADRLRQQGVPLSDLDAGEE